MRVRPNVRQNSYCEHVKNVSQKERLKEKNNYVNNYKCR